MCGRYYLLSTFDPKVEEIIEKSYKETAFSEGEVRPTDDAPVLIGYDGKIYAKKMHWGYQKKIINARSETLEEKYLFKEDYQYRRCLVPVTHFYEWQDHKIKYGFTTHETLYLAALYNPALEFTIITTKANEQVLPIHPRMPIIISKDHFKDWLFNDEKASHLITNYTAPSFELFIEQ